MLNQKVSSWTHLCLLVTALHHRRWKTPATRSVAVWCSLYRDSSVGVWYLSEQQKGQYIPSSSTPHFVPPFRMLNPRATYVGATLRPDLPHLVEADTFPLRSSPFQ